MELLEPRKRRHVAGFEMLLPDVIEDRISRSDAIVVHVFLMRPLVVHKRQEVLVQPTERKVCHKDIPDWFGVLDGVCNIPELHIKGPVRIILDKTSFNHEFVQGIVIVTISWDGGIDKVENLLDAEVAIVEGSANRKRANDCPASPDARNGRRADEVVPESRWDVDITEQLGWGLVVGGGAEYKWGMMEEVV